MLDETIRVLEIIQDKIEYYEKLSETQNGFETACKGAVAALKDLAKEIRDLASTGKITVNQAANIIARFGKVNMLSEISVSSFVNYMTNVFSDAEYASKLSAAKSLKSSIASLSKNKEKNADLRELAKQFIEIDPSMVDDIDAYNDMASKIKEAISGSSIKSPNVNLARTVDIESSLEYISKTLEAQDKLMREVKAAEIQQLMGIDVSEFSYDDMVELLKKDKPTTKYNEGIVRSTINKMFNVFSAMISENIKNNEDPITGEKRYVHTLNDRAPLTDPLDLSLHLLLNVPDRLLLKPPDRVNDLTGHLRRHNFDHGNFSSGNFVAHGVHHVSRFQSQ
jgi:ribosomal protein S20